MQRVYVQVTGFTSVERHALNTVFRLSQDERSDRRFCYEPWTSQARSPAVIALIDGSDPGASQALLDLASRPEVGIIWIGSIAPARAWVTMQRPLKWPVLLQTLDDYVSYRVSTGFAETDAWPSVVDINSGLPSQHPRYLRALIADADEPSRMYLRSKLAAYDITDVSESTNLQDLHIHFDAQDHTRVQFDVIVIDVNLPGEGLWKLLENCSSASLKILTGEQLTMAHRLNAKMSGFKAMRKPLDLTRLNEHLFQIR